MARLWVRAVVARVRGFQLARRRRAGSRASSRDGGARPRDDGLRCRPRLEPHQAGSRAREDPRGSRPDRVRALRLRCRLRHARPPVVRAARTRGNVASARTQRHHGSRRRRRVAARDPAVLAEHRRAEDGLPPCVLRCPHRGARRRSADPGHRLRRLWVDFEALALLAPTDAAPYRWFAFPDSAREAVVDFEALALLAPTDAAPYRWYAFPELRHDEAVAFRTYDTELVERGETWFTPHSAFRDPDVEVGHPARNSIELRAICLYR